MTDSSSNQGRATSAVLDQIVHDRVSQATFVLVSTVVTLLYSLLLPYSFTQRVSFHNWHYLETRLFTFSVAFGLTIGSLITLQVYATRRLIRAPGTGMGGTAAGVGVLPSLLCCTPIVRHCWVRRSFRRGTESDQWTRPVVLCQQPEPDSWRQPAPHRRGRSVGDTPDRPDSVPGQRHLRSDRRARRATKQVRSIR